MKNRGLRWWAVPGGALCCALFVLAATPNSGLDPVGQQQLQAAHSLLASHYDSIAHRMGAAEAEALQERLDDDLGAYLSGDVPENFSKPDWIVRLNAVAALDASLVSQLAAADIEPISGVKGLAERLFISTVDKTRQPFALYVPASVSATPTLVILLHGNPQTEAEILSGPWFRTLADSTGTIVAAPLARGVAGYPPPADADVYQLADAVAAAYHVAPHRTYLVGYSNGGFAVFKLGPKKPGEWQGIMCIAGAVLNSETAAVRNAFRNTRVYVVNGAKDENIPPQYGRQTALWLSGVGIPAGFYQDPKATHYIPTLMPVLSQAWREMIAGYISPNAAQAAAAPANEDRLTIPSSDSGG